MAGQICITRPWSHDTAGAEKSTSQNIAEGAAEFKQWSREAPVAAAVAPRFPACRRNVQSQVRKTLQQVQARLLALFRMELRGK